jgi:hypothetical protein
VGRRLRPSRPEPPGETVDRGPRRVVAALFDRLGRHEPAAIIAGFAFSPLTVASFSNINTAIAHLRDVLGEQT